MPPRVTYWTGIWDPAREALSREVDVLRRMHGTRALVVSFSPGQRSARPRDGVFQLSSRRWMLLRALAGCLERTGDVTHVLGPMDAWHLLRAVGRRPVLFTVATPGQTLDAALYGKVRMFAAETEPLAVALRESGVSPDRIRVVHPGVDLDRFTPAPPPDGRFRVVFASSPAHVEEFGARGIPLLVEAARLCPEVEFVLQWRQWGSRSAAAAALSSLQMPANVRVDHDDAVDMAGVFQRVHATIWLAEPGHGKSCPNSVVEGLACGRPAVVSPSCGIADLIRRAGAGLTPERDPEAVAHALRTLVASPEAWQTRARAAAERFFSAVRFCETYRSLYHDVSQRSAVTVRSRAAALPSVKRSDYSQIQ